MTFDGVVDATDVQRVELDELSEFGRDRSGQRVHRDVSATAPRGNVRIRAHEDNRERTYSMVRSTRRPMSEGIDPVNSLCARSLREE